MELLDKYKQQLLNSIPVITGMDIDIIKVESNTIELIAPLNTNINYEGTAFGGSINTLGILSCYLLSHHLLNESGVDFNSLVIQDSSIKYLKPVNGDFIAKSEVINKSDQFFIKTLKSRGVGRISLTSKIYTQNSNEACAEFYGRFVASK